MLSPDSKPDSIFKPGTKQWVRVAFVLLFVAMPALGVYGLWALGEEMLLLDRLRREGVVVTGHVVSRHTEWRWRDTCYVVEYAYPPGRGGTGRAPATSPASTKDARLLAKVDKVLTRWEKELSSRPARDGAERAKTAQLLRQLRRRNWPHAEEAVPHKLYEPLRPGQDVPVTLVPGKAGLRALGRVDRARVWSVPLEHWYLLVMGVLFTGAGLFLLGTMLMRRLAHARPANGAGSRASP